MGLLLQLAAVTALLKLDQLGIRTIYRMDLVPRTWPDLLATMGMLQGFGILATWFNSLEEARATARRAADESAALLVQAQAHPHEMVNMLDAVSYLIDEDPAQAKILIEAASGYHRGLFRATQACAIPLGQERSLVSEYLQVQAIRMGDRLQVEWDWPEAHDAAMIPPILIQPLVENAIKHGIWPARSGGTLRISVHLREGHLVITVANTGEPLTRDHREGGAGLALVRQRLELTYGPAAWLTIESASPWTLASVAIPMESLCVA
jgi:LytS/YehU family sensor histidine kinase